MKIRARLGTFTKDVIIEDDVATYVQISEVRMLIQNAFGNQLLNQSVNNSSCHNILNFFDELFCHYYHYYFYLVYFTVLFLLPFIIALKLLFSFLLFFFNRRIYPNVPENNKQSESFEKIQPETKNIC